MRRVWLATKRPPSLWLAGVCVAHRPWWELESSEQLDYYYDMMVCTCNDLYQLFLGLPFLLSQLKLNWREEGGLASLMDEDDFQCLRKSKPRRASAKRKVVVDSEDSEGELVYEELVVSLACDH